MKYSYRINSRINVGLWLTGIAACVITVIMDYVLFPKIEATTEGIKAFDLNTFGYSYETAVKFLQLISDKGRSIYLHIQLPLDFVYPLIYTAFFILLFIKLMRKPSALIALPLLLSVSDYIENICSIIMLKSSELSPALAHFASGATIAKTILMTLCFIVTAGLIFMRMTKNKK